MIIKDNMFKENLLNRIDAELHYAPLNIKWVHHSTNKNADTGRVAYELTNNYFFYEEMKPILQQELNFEFYIQRVYLNVMSYGSEGSYHYDSLEPNAYTILYFSGGPPDSETADEYGGYFYYKENKEIKCIEPIHNRMIVFNSDIIHKASSFNRMIKSPRFSITWKIYKK
jgi:Rps23 Pro-64 3,4-dihydroxylase Tpa1-like proline 4-hydroxylase